METATEIQNGEIWELFLQTGLFQINILGHDSNKAINVPLPRLEASLEPIRLKLQTRLLYVFVLSLFFPPCRNTWWKWTLSSGWWILLTSPCCRWAPVTWRASATKGPSLRSAWARWTCGGTGCRHPSTERLDWDPMAFSLTALILPVPLLCIWDILSYQQLSCCSSWICESSSY